MRKECKQGFNNKSQIIPQHARRENFRRNLMCAKGGTSEIRSSEHRRRLTCVKQWFSIRSNFIPCLDDSWWNLETFSYCHNWEVASGMWRIEAKDTAKHHDTQDCLPQQKSPALQDFDPSKATLAPRSPSFTQRKISYTLLQLSLLPRPPSSPLSFNPDLMPLPPFSDTFHLFSQIWLSQ